MTRYKQYLREHGTPLQMDTEELKRLGIEEARTIVNADYVTTVYFSIYNFYIYKDLHRDGRQNFSRSRYLI